MLDADERSQLVIKPEGRVVGNIAPFCREGMELPRPRRLADVVNNTTYAYFVQMEQSSRVLLFNILAGAESMGADDTGRRFSWQNIIGTLNRAAKNECPREDPDADCRHYRPRKAHEMYGVSGVRDNQFTPNSRSAN